MVSTGSPSGTAQRCLAGYRPNVAEAGSSGTLTSQPANVHVGDHQQAQAFHGKHTDLQQQRARHRHQPQRREMTEASDEAEQRTMHVVPSHSPMQQSTGAEQQDQSDRGSEQSEPCEHVSDGAVGDNELLEHEPDMATETRAAEAANLAPSWRHTGCSSVPFGIHSTHKPSGSSHAEADVLADQLPQADRQSLGILPLD